MFEESKIDVFMGGKFTFENKPRTVAELKIWFSNCIKELDGWGDGSATISEVAIIRNEIVVPLDKGLY